MKQPKISYIVWKIYQRRSEVLATRLEAEIEFMPHLFQSKYLRPLDYALKFIGTIKHILQYQPEVIIFQGPPLLPAFPSLLMQVPYVIDAHNATFQGFWSKVPLSDFFIKKAAAVIVHNSEILQLAEKKFPQTKFLSILDPLERIYRANKERIANQILIICSFNSDEPIDVIIESIRKLPDYKFIITADINKLQPTQRQQLRQLNNLHLTGFLSKEDYQDLLCSSLAALVLTTRDSTQPSGACEALSSDTQLIVSETDLTRKLFGDWAILVDNSAESIVSAIRSLELKELELSHYRDEWETLVLENINNLNMFIKL
jgi:glycosyltransferase involved in cell wall biosynthesis